MTQDRDQWQHVLVPKHHAIKVHCGGGGGGNNSYILNLCIKTNLLFHPSFKTTIIQNILSICMFFCCQKKLHLKFINMRKETSIIRLLGNTTWKR
jgi:hypothetical protein